MPQERNNFESFDITLALTDYSKNDLKAIELISNYSIEDASENGWGLVISADSRIEGPLDDQIHRFLQGLLPLKKWIVDSSPILRIAVFNKNLTCTIRLENYKILEAFKIKLEITLYPTE